MNTTNRRHLDGGVSHCALLAASALAMLAAAQPAAAQNAGSVAASETLPAIAVEGTAEQEPNTLSAPLGASRLPGTVQDTPQIINVVPAKTLEDQGVSTLDQALRNVPGITVNIGEGGGGMNGDQFRIRGLDAKNDIYTDGLRDFGVYTRDSFNYEQVEVLKGPTGATFGRGSTGGVINSTTKTPLLDSFYRITGSIGTGIFARGTVDFNQQLSDTIAIRLNAVGSHAELVKRDAVESERWAVAPSIAFGLGTNTQFTLEYMHFQDNKVPDYGQPVINGRPAHVDRSNWYGLESDHDDVTIDRLTGRFSHRFGPALTVFNDTRLGIFDRDFTPVPPSCNDNNGNTCQTDYLNALNGVPGANPMVSRGGPGPYEQEGWGIQNVTSLVADLNLGLRQQIVAGLDVSYEDDERVSFAYTVDGGATTVSKPGTSLFDPSDAVPAGWDWVPVQGTGTQIREGHSTEIGMFASDRVWLTDQISLLGGLRVTHYTSEFATITGAGTRTPFKTSDTFVDPKLSVIFEPVPSQTYYVSWARSTTPSGVAVTNSTNPLNANNEDLKPEKNESFEAGAKVSMLDDRLGVTAAAFQVTKGNAKEDDPNNPGTQISSGEKQRIRGIELGVTGRILERWQIMASYMYLKSKILQANNAANAVNDGNEVTQVPRHAVTLWTTFEPVDRLEFGLGGNYRSKVSLNSNNDVRAPHNISVDGLISYRFDMVRVALNGYNLLDRRNFDTLWTNRLVPSAGRTVIFTTGVQF